MIRRTLLATALAAGGAALAFSGVASGHDPTTLRGTVGPGFTISLAKKGQRVTRLAPGTYRIIVSDRSARHDFKLEKYGGAFERSITTVPFIGTKTVTVKLTSGRWEFYCAPHERTMKGRFVVSAAVTTTTSTTTTTDDDDDDGGNGPGGGYG
jgi:plastocyanin